MENIDIALPLLYYSLMLISVHRPLENGTVPIHALKCMNSTQVLRRAYDEISMYGPLTFQIFCKPFRVFGANVTVPPPRMALLGRIPLQRWLHSSQTFQAS